MNEQNESTEDLTFRNKVETTVEFLEVLIRAIKEDDGSSEMERKINLAKIMVVKSIIDDL